MSIEVATYINDLQPTNPPGTDPRSQGDDHLRLIKSVLQNTLLGGTRAFSIPGVVAVSGVTAFSVLKSQQGTIYINTGSGAVTVTLPVLTSVDAGWNCNIMKTSADYNPMFITPPSGTINSGSTPNVARARRCIPGVRITAVWDGSAWFCSRALALPIGSLIEIWVATLPVGFEWPNGQVLASVATNYPEWNAFYNTGTVPDKRGRVGIPLDNLGGPNAGRLANNVIVGTTVGNSGGGDAIYLSQAQCALPSHYHTATIYDPTHAHNYSSAYSSGLPKPNGTGTTPFDSLQTLGTAAAATGVRIQSANGYDTVSTSGAGASAILGLIQPSVMVSQILVVE